MLTWNVLIYSLGTDQRPFPQARAVGVELTQGLSVSP